MNAVIFPGQGAQFPGMGRELYETSGSARNIFDSIDRLSGLDISGACRHGSREALNDPYNQQLGILAVSIAGYECFKASEVKVDFVSGLSLGEYHCIYAAGVLDLAGMVDLIKKRAHATVTAEKECPSAMLAVIGIEAGRVLDAARGKDFYAANINSPRQVVLSLPRSDVARLECLFKELGARTVEMDIEGGFHSPLMHAAHREFADAISGLKFNDARIPVVSNVTGKTHTRSCEIKDNLIAQLVKPVLWMDCVRFMAAAGVDTFFETGPGRSLRGIIRKIDSGIKVVNIDTSLNSN